MDSAAAAFDFVIVGAGTAGCALAGRLAEDPAVRVCLIEAGGNDGHPFIHTPALVAAAIVNRNLNWRFETVPQAQLHGRRIPQPRGRVVGAAGGHHRRRLFGRLLALGRSGELHGRWDVRGRRQPGRQL